MQNVLITLESKILSAALAQLDTFAQSSNDVRLCQELVRDELSRSDSDSECDASSNNCGDFGHALHVVAPLRTR